MKFDTIRKKWDEKHEKWYFSIVDIVSVVTSSTNPRNYWKVFKYRLKAECNQLVTKCNQLKLESSDGKFYLTDVAEVNVATEIIKLLSPENSLFFKAWALRLSRPKNVKNALPLLRQRMGNEISLKTRKESYPQVTYNLANLVNKKFKANPAETSGRETNRKKVRMRTI